MKKIIFTLLIGCALAGCQKRNFVCYDQVIDNQGNITAGTTGKEKKHFVSDSDALDYQHKHNKVCIKLE